MSKFKLYSRFKPTGDQPQAIKKLSQGIQAGLSDQVLLGVTGSGKTFTMANVIQNVQKPTLVISHNKTLAAQLAQEFKEFFPKNAVEYFVSYYDYYQPEAYVPRTDTYIAKETDINDLIEKLRLSATTSLLTRRDVVVIASVSCIYNLGPPVEYGRYLVNLKKGKNYPREQLFRDLIRLRYERNDFDLKRGGFRVKGEVVDIYPSWRDEVLRITFLEDKIEKVALIKTLTGETIEELIEIDIYPARHYLTGDENQPEVLQEIRRDLKQRIDYFKSQKKLLEAQRIEQMTNYDLEMIQEVGYCSGIENYSRYFDRRKPGEPPYTLLDYFPKDYLLIIDESHITIPQIRGMYRGDQSRKKTLVDFGFRLPSALDNRPLRFSEFWQRVNQTICTSATPEEFEIKRSQKTVKRGTSKVSHRGVVEQLIRPTGVLDPKIEVRKTQGQIKDLIKEIRGRVGRKERVLVTTLTKRMAEDLADYLKENEIKVHYLHAEVDTLERTDILESLRKGKYDVVVGINLLREGLDLPEVSLVAILDADKEGYLRSKIALIQVMGRAARHVNGQVLMYADEMTKSMKGAIEEINRRRKIQEDYNHKHKIKPKSIKKPIREKLIDPAEILEEEGRIKGLSKSKRAGEFGIDFEKIKQEWLETLPEDRKKILKVLEAQMRYFAKELLFEEAAILRDQIKKLKSLS